MKGEKQWEIKEGIINEGNDLEWWKKATESKGKNIVNDEGKQGKRDEVDQQCTGNR